MNFDTVWRDCDYFPSENFHYMLIVSDGEYDYVYHSYEVDSICEVLVKMILWAIDYQLNEGDYSYDEDEQAQAALEELYDKFLNMLRRKNFNLNEITKYLTDTFDTRLRYGLFPDGPSGTTFTIIDLESGTMESYHC